MKKTLSILLVAILAISSVIGVSAAVIKNTPSNTVATPDCVQTAENTPMLTQTEEDIIDLPDVTGTWKHVDDNGCSIQVVKQEGNRLYLTIESHNSNYTKIATSRLILTLDTHTNNKGVFGIAFFNYSDSFGSGGRGSIVVYEDQISLDINKEFDPCAAWNITAAKGDYYFYSENVNPHEEDRFNHLPENQQIFDFEPTTPYIEGLWKSTTNEGASIQILNQDGNNADLVIELHNANYTKIATAKVPVTFTPAANDTSITATADFDYCDSFGSSGTGTITFDGKNIWLELNEEVGSLWSIAPAAGEFTMA